MSLLLRVRYLMTELDSNFTLDASSAGSKLSVYVFKGMTHSVGFISIFVLCDSVFSSSNL